MAGRIEESTNAKGVKDTWRKQEHTYLNGLVMIDFDHVAPLTPPEGGKPGHTEGNAWAYEIVATWQKEHPEWFDASKPLPSGEVRVGLIHVTPSGEGLRVVAKADAALGNLADNAHAFAKAVGIPLDEACKDSSRGSFVCTQEDIIYMNPEIFEYEDKNFDDQFGQNYRMGNSAPRKSRCENTKSRCEVRGTRCENTKEAENGNEQGNLVPRTSNLEPRNNEDLTKHLEFNEQHEPCYNGVPFTRIVEEYWKQDGGKPSVGERHTRVLSMANRLRYIAGNHPQALLRVIDHCGLPDAEVQDICDSACAYKMAPFFPPRLRSILEAVGAGRRGGAPSDSPEGGEKGQGAVPIDYEGYWKRLSPLLHGAFADACEPMPDNIKLAGVLAAGAMFGTYLTRLWWQHYDGQERRLSFLAYFIGNAASGKSFTLDLDKLIMEPMRSADNAGREWERKYKEDKQKRATSSAAQKKQAEDIKHPVIRYVPSTISNAMLYQRLADAVEVVNGEPMHLHLYTCEAELATALRVQQGSWAGKLDLECKSFQNEYAGVDYKNEGSCNGIFQVNWNQVISGTPDAMNRKIKPTTILDGLVTRLALFVMPDSNFTMIQKKRALRNHEAEVRLRTWGHKLDKLWGEVKCEKLVDAAYEWCAERARQAELENDTVADYFRKRVPMYMVRYGIVYNIMRDFDYVSKQDATKGIKLRITKQDLQFAELIGDFIYYMQIRQYGEMVRVALENQTRDFVPRQRQTRNADAFNKLPSEFTLKEAQNVLGLSYSAICSFLTRVASAGYVERIKQGAYKKIKNM